MVRRGIVIPEYDEVMSEPEKNESEELEQPQEQLQSDNKETTNQLLRKSDDNSTNNKKLKDIPIPQEKSSGRGL